MIKKNQLIDYLPLAFWFGVFVLLKLYHREAATDGLLYLLQPIAFFVSQFTGLEFLYLQGQGYLNADAAILIDKSCSGMNYLIILWTLACFVAWSWKLQSLLKIALFSVFLFLAYLMAILANCSRIIQIIWLGKLYPNSSFLHSPLGHEMQGVLVYFTLLVAFYFILRSLNPRNQINYGKNI
ncbi:MAG: exosortase K [Bacteroidota bacterium]